MNEKPIFIPLKTEYFDAFERGEKGVEYRAYGPRWNEKTCPAGRRVVLSKGYGKHKRLTGVIVEAQVVGFPWNVPNVFYSIYPQGAICFAIRIKLDAQPVQEGE
ncbi:MAG: hypothetical protein WCW93_03870 [Candidatus Paceibacterota bacterium]|jgi:hypothetical protein